MSHQDMSLFTKIRLQPPGTAKNKLYRTYQKKRGEEEWIHTTKTNTQMQKQNKIQITMRTYMFCIPYQTGSLFRFILLGTSVLQDIMVVYVLSWRSSNSSCGNLGAKASHQRPLNLPFVSLRKEHEGGICSSNALRAFSQEERTKHTYAQSEEKRRVGGRGKRT